MRSKWLVGLPILALSFMATRADAHFKLEQPADALNTAGNGDPTGGDQKTPPCGVGTSASGIVTRVKAGSKLHIKLTETIAHGGHYRVALSSNKDQFTDPTPVVQNNNCVSAPIQNTPTAPVLADGLFEHAQADFAAGKVWETDVTLPTTPCPDCTLQIIEFMTPHAPGCFYHHCAKLEIVDASTDLPDGGEVIMTDAGNTTSSSGSSGASSSGDTASGGSTSSSGSSGTRKLASSSDDGGGCSVANGSSPSYFVLGILGVTIASRLRRRRRT